jgi:N12 class adenine-specific DNA methylase
VHLAALATWASGLLVLLVLRLRHWLNLQSAVLLVLLPVRCWFLVRILETLLRLQLVRSLVCSARRLSKKPSVKSLSSTSRKGLRKEAAEQMAAQSVRNTLAKRAGAGIAASQATALHESGGMWGEQKEKGIDNPVSALALGQISGVSEAALGAVPSGLRMFIGKTAAAEVARKSGPRMAAGYLWDAVRNAGEEGVQEGFQEFLGDVNARINDPKAKILTKENFMKWAEAGAQGAVVGGLFGTGEAAQSAYSDFTGNQQIPSEQSADTLSKTPEEASRMPPVAPVQPSPPPMPAAAPPTPIQPPAPSQPPTAPPVQPPAIPGQPPLTPEQMSRIASLETRPSAHKWAEIVLGDRALFKRAPEEAERVQAWEQSRAAVAGQTTQGGTVPPIPGQQPITTEGVDNGVRQQSESQGQQEQPVETQVGQGDGQIDEAKRLRFEEEVKARLKARQATEQQGGTTPPAASQAMPSEEISKSMQSAGAGVVDGMYDKIWNDLQSGSLKKMAKPPLFEQLALKGQERGVVRSVEDLRSISAGMTGDFETDKKVGLENLNKLASKYSSEQKPEIVPASAKQWKRDERVFVPAQTTASGEKLEDSVGSIFKVLDGDNVVVSLDGDTKYRTVPKSTLQAPDATFEVGEEVGVPWSDEKKAKITKKRSDGTYELVIGARMVTQTADQMVKMKPKKEAKPVASSVPDRGGQEVEPVAKNKSDWVQYDSDTYGLKVESTGVGKAEATLRFDGDTSQIYIDMFAAQKGAKKGSGRSLLRSVVEKSKQYKPRQVSGHFTNPAALGALGAEFGRDNVSFYLRNAAGGAGKKENVTFEEAMQDPGKYFAVAELVKPAEKISDAPAKKNDDGMSVSKIRGMLDSVRQKIAAQGRVVDDRLISREKELARLLADAEKEESKAKQKEVGDESETRQEPKQSSAGTVGQDRVPISEFGVKGKSTAVITADGKTRKATYYAIEAEKLIPSHDARRNFARNEGALENERPYHDPKQGADSRETVEKISKVLPDKVSLLTSDTQSPIDGPPILDEFGAVLGGNARSMGMQLAYSGKQAARLKSHIQSEAEKFGIDQKDIGKLKEPVIVRVLDEVFDKTTISSLLNEALSASKSQATDAVSQAKRVSEGTVDLIAGILASDDTLSLRDAMANPKHADRIVRALVKDGAWTTKQTDRYVDPVTSDLNSDGKSAIEQLLTAKAIPDATVLGDAAPSVKQKVLSAIGPLAKGMADKKHGKQLLSDLLEAVQAYDGYVADRKAGGSLQSYFMDQQQLIAGPGYRNYSAAGLVHALYEMSPTKFRNAMKDLIGALGIGEKTASLFSDMNQTFESLPEAIKSVIDPPLNDIPVSQSTRVLTLDDAADDVLAEILAEEKPKKRTGRKDGKAPAAKKPLGEKLTGKKRPKKEPIDTEAAAKAAALKAANDAMKQFASDIRSLKAQKPDPDVLLQSIPAETIDRDSLKKIVQVSLLYVRAGKDTFGAYVDAIVENFGSDFAREFAPYMEAGWRALERQKIVSDPAISVIDYLGEKADGTRTEMGEPDQERTGRSNADREKSGSAATSGTLEGEQPANGEKAGGARDSGGLRDSNAESVQSGRDATGDGREVGNVGSGTDVPGGVDVGSGETGGDGFTKPGDGAGIDLAPKSSRPNFHLTNPDIILGRGLKDKFARNVRALELSQELEESGRAPTQEELETIASYIGWGAFGQELFQGNWNNPKVKKDWESENEWLREHLGEEEWRSAQESIPNAHYTDPEVVVGMWEMLRRMGFRGGRFLEPSFGIGNFAAMMPRDIMDRTNFTAIELDKATARMAKMLYPQINVQQKGYQDSRTPNDFYDVTATNVPFGNYKIHDRMYRMPYSIHNYFFRKAIDQTKPGGIMAFVTSNMTMDGKDEAKLLRKQLSDRGDLIAAFRFPTGAFERYAKTKVVADLIIIRKRKDGESPSSVNQEWIDVIEMDTPSGQKVDVNNYWKLHPENVLGTINYGNGTTSGRPGMIVDKPSDLAERWQKAIESVPENILNTERTANEGRERANEKKLRQNTVIHQGDELYIAKGEQLMPLKEYVNWYRAGSKPETVKKIRDEMVSLLKVRDSLEQVLELQGRGEDAAEQRKQLNQFYDAFIGKYGPITESKAIGYLKASGDAIANAVASLEMKTANGEYEKRPVFTKTTVRQPPRVNEKLNPIDAFALARNNSVDIDWDAVAKSAQMPKADVIAVLEKEGLIYKTGEDLYDAADVFLSGNMARKIRQLEAAKNEGVNGLERSIEAAKSVMPEPLVYNQIQVSMGAPWIPAEDYTQFVADLLGEDPKNTRVLKAIRGWKVDFAGSVNNSPAVVTHGHMEVPFSKMVSAAMNNGRVSVFYKDAEGNNVKDEEATFEANAKIDELKDKFKDWIWQTPDRIARLSQAYNEDHRSVATPDWNKVKVPLLFEGLALQRGEDPFSLRKHQEAAVWRGIVSGKGLYAHEVGTGKTLTMAALAIESRRLRLANKPVLFAHNANSQAVYREAQEAYPGAKILYVDNLDSKNKGQAMASIATEDWDLIVIPHSLVDKLKMRPETLEKLLQEQMDQLEAAALEAFNEDDSPFKGSMPENLDNIDDDDLKKLKQRTAKELVKERLRLRERIREAQADSASESTIFIEDMGVDMLMVDEAHIFKKIPIATRQQVKGLNKQSSNIGNSLMLLSDYIRGTQNGRGVFLFTGTPVTNTLNEIYNMQRFIMPDEMQAVGVKDWDGWFNTFATAETSDELSVGGTYEEFVRLTSFVNLPELRASIGQYMDTVFGSDMPEFVPRPTKDGRIEEGEPVVGRPYKEVHNETLQMMPIQKLMSENLKERYRTLKQATGKAKFELLRTREYMPLVLNSEGVKLALDPRLMDGVDASLVDPRDPRLKINKMLVNAMDYYYSHPKATQMIFMEMGHKDSAKRVVGRDNDGKPITENVKIFNLGKEIKRRLMEEGVPESEIALFSNMNKEQRAEAARAMNRGEIRFAIGGTETLGTGVNAQENLVAMHHLDAPWMPGALEQRNGRGFRQGNRWNTVHEHRYLTEGPQDGRRWQVLLTKDRFINRFMHHKGDERIIDMSDVDMDEEGEGDFEATFSAAVGDPRIQQRFRLEREIVKLKEAKDRHYRTIQDSLWEAHKQKTGDIPRLTREIDDLSAIQKAYQDSRPQKSESGKSVEPTMVLSDLIKVADKNISGAEAITDALEMIVERYGRTQSTEDRVKASDKRKVAEYRGVSIFISGGQLHAEKMLLEINPSFASMDGVLRNVGKRIDARKAEKAKKESFVKSADESAKLPFVRQQQLDAKVAKLKALVAELESNPEGSPFWFRNIAPIGTSIFVKKRKRPAVPQAMADMQAELYRERVTGEESSDGAKFELEEHAVSGYRSDTHVLYEDGVDTVAVRADKVLDEQGEPIFKNLEELRSFHKNPDLGNKLSDLPADLAQMESGDVDSTIEKQAIDIAMAAMDANINSFDKLVAYSVKSLGERRTREIGPYLRLVAQIAGFAGVRSTSDVLGTPGVTREQVFSMARAAFPSSSLSDEQINAALDIMERVGLSFDKVGFAPFGSPVPKKLEEMALQGGGDYIKGWTSFISATRAIIGATDKADVSTFIHEIAHPLRRFLLNRRVPQSERAGITDSEIIALEKEIGVENGVWKVENEEKFAKMWEQYWFEGIDPPSSGLKGLFQKIARWMQGVYRNIQQITGGPLPSEVRALFDKLVQRSGDIESADSLSKNDDFVTSIKNEVVNELRFRRGVPGLVDVASETQEEWLEAAETMLRNDPMLGDRLVKEINQKARNLSNIEVAVMQLHYRQVTNQLIKASDRLIKAKDNGDSLASAQALTDTDIIQNALAEIEEAAKAAGREWGRAGVARQIELAKDFSSVALIRKARVANAGNALNEEQLAKIRELAARVAELEGDLAKANQEKLDLERQRNVDAQIEDSKKKGGRIPEAIRKKAVDKLTSFKNKFASVFALSSADDTGSLYATEDEMMASEAKSVVQAYVDLGVFSLGEFLANIRKDLGAELPVSVRAAFATAWKELSENGDIPVPAMDKGDTRGLSRLAKQIERSLVEAGITERDDVLQGVWESLQEIDPEISKRETMDALSGYGQYSPPSDNEYDKIIADINAQLLQLSKLQDMEAGIAPAKTGFGRQEPSNELRDLIREVNQEKRNGKYRVTDENTQLKTAIGAAKTALRNRIYDLDRAVNVTKQPIAGSQKRDLAGKDTELDNLRKKRNELMADYKAMFPKPEATMDQRIAATNRVLDRVIADLEKQLRTGEFNAKKQAQPISTPELDAKRARIEALRAQRDSLVGVRKRTPEQIEKAYKANLLKQIADYKERIAKSEFDPKPRKEVRILSQEELDLKRELADVKDQFFRMAADYRLANMSPGERVWDYIKETAHLSRALMTSIDASAVFRQGGTVAFGHPMMAKAVAKDMYRAMLSKSSEFKTAEEIRKDDLYQFAITAGLQITEEEGKITKQEEAYMGRWARDGIGAQGTWLNDKSKIALWPVAASARGYMTFLNGIRFQLFKHLIANLGRGGQVTADEAKVIAMYINAATGRSDLGPMMRWAEQMNMVFFAPRFVASRFQYLGLPLWLLGNRKVSGRVKKAIAMEYVRHATGVMSFLGLTVALGRLLGGDDEEEKPTVSLDPRSSDFLKIKIGETRIDPMSGLSQVVVLASRIATGKRVRADGEVVSLRGDDKEHATSGVFGVMADFLRTKLAPIPGAIVDIPAEENVVGQTVTPASAAVNLVFPLSLREISDTAESRGIPQGVLITLLSLHGMGASTYGSRSNYRKATPEKRQKQFVNDLKRMEFDSPDPAYKEMLTKDQMAQVRQRREEKKQGLVYAATSNPDRKTARSVESYNQSLAEQKSAIESLKRSGVTLAEARQLLIKHWEDRYGSAKEMRGGVYVYKPALSDQLQQLRKVFSR